MNALRRPKPLGITLVSVVLVLGSVRVTAGHCDSLDGPIVPEALGALETGDVTLVLKWVAAEQEEAVRDAFDAARRVRASGDEARELADHYFLETLVRLHRQSEGAAFTGLRPAGSARPLVSAADQALAQANIDRLAEHIADAVSAQLAARFAVALERREHAHASVEDGRLYVDAYVDFMHFVESMDQLLEHGEPATAAGGHEH